MPQTETKKEKVSVVIEHGFIEKRDEDRYLLAPVLFAEERDRQGDIYSDREVEKAAWSFSKNGFVTDYMHKVQLGPDDAAAVESFVYRPEIFGPLVVKNDDGTETTHEHNVWLMGMLLGENLWKLKKAGKITGLSITGIAKRTPEPADTDDDNK